MFNPQKLLSLSEAFARAVMTKSESDAVFGAAFGEKFAEEEKRIKIDEEMLTNLDGFGGDVMSNALYIALGEAVANALIAVSTPEEIDAFIPVAERAQENSDGFARINAKQQAKLFAPKI